LFVAFVAGCPGDDPPSPDAAPAALFPASYLDSYVEVRDCRTSGDHELRKIRVLADPLAKDAYMLRDRPFPVGAILLKEERDDSCDGEIASFTVMVRLADGSSPSTLDWQWQRVDPKTMRDATEDPARCINCHSGCADPPDFYLHTCAIPP
jgi:hypothetical protein